MPAGDSDSEEETREYPAFTGPYPRQPEAGDPRFEPRPGGVPRPSPPPSPSPPSSPPTGWPSRRPVDDRYAQPAPRGLGVRRGVPEPRYATSGLTVSAGLVLLVFGLVATLVGLAGVALGDLLDEVVRIARDADVDLTRRALRTLFTSASWVLLAVGAVHLLSAFGVFLHRQSARFVGILLALPGTAIGALSVMLTLPIAQRGTGEGAGLAVAVVVTMGYGIALFGLIVGGRHFQAGR
jgi:hypothetical protein